MSHHPLVPRHLRSFRCTSSSLVFHAAAPFKSPLGVKRRRIENGTGTGVAADWQQVKVNGAAVVRVVASIHTN